MDITEVKQIIDDVKSIKIQGATNVAYAVIQAVDLAIQKGVSDVKELEDIAKAVAFTRLNEPLAQNAVKYIFRNKPQIDFVKKRFDEYRALIKESKEKVEQHTLDVLKDADIVFTHCHSSTTISALDKLHKANPSLKVVNTETRPLFQGRMTSTDLVNAGIETYMIVDDAAVSFIVDKTFLDVDAILIGCDEILKDGGIVNKVGSYGLAMAALKAIKPIYVMTTLLKLDTLNDYESVNIENRDGKEVWAEAPTNLTILNPAFDKVPFNLLTGFITEEGLLKPSEVLFKAKEIYNWL